MKDRPTSSVIRALGKLSKRWLDPDFSFRRRAVRILVRRSGLSERMAQEMLDALFRELTAPKLKELLRSELKDPAVLDGFRRDGRRALRARGPESILHIFASNAPQAPVFSFILGMLVQSRNVGKLSGRDEGFLPVYLASLKNADPALWAQNKLVPAKDRQALAAHAKQAELVVAYGSGRSLAEIRKLAPASTPFCGYGHRWSAALYLKEALSRKNARRLAAAAARDAWMIDQRGCLSPAAVYAQEGGQTAPKQFAALLAAELQKLQKKDKILPKRGLQARAAAHGLYGRHLVSQLKGRPSAFWESSPRGLWTVIYEENTLPPSAVSSQTVVVRGFRSAAEVLSSWKPLRHSLQCVALEGSDKHRASFAETISALGANRVCRAGKMQHPPAAWHHDGRPNLASWLRWTDLE